VVQLDFNLLDLSNINQWNRRILNGYWLVVVLSMLVASLQLNFTILDPVFFIKNYIVFPTAILISIVLIMEFIHYRYKKGTAMLPYYIILCGTCIATVLIAVHPSVDPISVTLLLPLLTSCIYYQRNKVVFALVTCLVSLTLLILLNPVLHDKTTIVDGLTIVAILFGGAFIALGIMGRGIEYLQHLKQTMNSSQDLMTKKVLMEKMVKMDALTDLNNHMSFHEYLDHLLHHSDSQGLSIQLALMDVDNFKQVNDTYGHHTGDQILKYAAQKIKELITPNDFVARYGGEEFAVIFIEKTLQESYDLTEKIRQELSQTPHEELEGKRITVSVGLNEYGKGDGKNVLFEGADIALYSAKRAGKNKTLIYSKKDQMRQC
jgi:diguanylate cyclase (GGDEF)-like protein